MLQKMMNGLLMLMLIGTCFPSAAAAEQVDDPGYVYWSKFSPGSVSTTTTVTELATQKMSMHMTTTLLAVTPEKVTIEVKTETESGGKKLPARVNKREIAPKRTKPPEEVIVNGGTETLTVGGKSYKCQLSEETRQTLHIKLWMCDKVPGGLVKMEMKDEAMTMATNLVEFTIK